MPKPEVIRIQDLAEPQLSPEITEVREMAESFAVVFSAEAVTAGAIDRMTRHGAEFDLTGDVWSESLLSRLQIVCDAAEADIGMHPSGRAGVWFDLVRYISNRALFDDLLGRHPEILEEEIVAPIIVAGLPRSGTTHLLNLLAADTRFRSLPYWESREPIPFPAEQETVKGEDPRYSRADRDWMQADSLLPLMKAMHALTPDHIHEEVELMAHDLSGYVFEWQFNAPAWRDYYLSTDQAPHYEYMRTVLKALQWLDRGRGIEPKRWVLKSPQHLEQLPALISTFPDATIPITHRDPTSVVASSATMTTYGDRLRRYKPDPIGTASYWADRIELLLGACERDRSMVPDGQSIDIRFDEFMADDLGTVASIYDKAGLTMTAQSKGQLTDYLASNVRGKHGRVVADLSADFGIDRDVLRHRYDSYMERFSVASEGMGE